MKKLIFALILFPSLCFAEQTPLTRYLTHEPASMMDIGIDKLNKTLNDLCLKDQPEWKKVLDNSDETIYEEQAFYDFDSDRIILSIMLHENKDIKIEKLKDLVRKIFFNIRLHCGVSPISGELAGKYLGMLGIFFSHSGYRTSFEPKELNYRIASIIKINIIIYNDKWVEVLHATGDVISKDIFYSK